MLTWSFLSQWGTAWCIITRWSVGQRSLLCWRPLTSHRYYSLLSAKEVCGEVPDQQGKGGILLLSPPFWVRVILYSQHIWIKPVSRKTPLEFLLLSAKDKAELFSLCPSLAYTHTWARGQALCTAQRLIASGSLHKIRKFICRIRMSELKMLLHDKLLFLFLSNKLKKYVMLLKKNSSKLQATEILKKI